MMIKGKLHRITSLPTFVASYLQTNGKPTQGFTVWGKARVHLVTDLPSGKFSGGFPPSMSLKTDADSQGAFAFQVSDGLAAFRGQIVAFESTTAPAPLAGMPPIPLLAPVYRSAVFKFSDVSPQEQAAVQNIYIFKATTPLDQGISQGQLNEEVDRLRASLGLDKLKATILSNRVSVSAEKRGGDVTFSAFVRGSTSHDLSRVIEVKAGDIDIDLPGPDAIVGLCVDEDQIEAQIRKGLVNLSKRVSQQLVAELDRTAPGLSSLATISVWRTRYAQTGTKKLIPVPGAPSVEVPVYSVVPDAAFGVPRALL
jgi:hypothetical protein